MPYQREPWGYAKQLYRVMIGEHISTLELAVIDVRDGIVDNVTVPLNNLSITDVLAAYGTPERIVDTGVTAIIVYPPEGLHFLVLKEAAEVTTAILMSEETQEHGSTMPIPR